MLLSLLLLGLLLWKAEASSCGEDGVQAPPALPPGALELSLGWRSADRLPLGMLWHAAAAGAGGSEHEPCKVDAGAPRRL